ncbi:MAG: DUF2878 domain-containing protein [Acidobacteria bacterium]|nr:DUF2878 domain-containing protein [Acidobacteriota bacterium]
MSKFANFAGFQVVWFGCVIPAAAGMPWIGIAVCLVWAWLYRRDVQLLCAAAGIGLAAETALYSTGSTAFPPQTWIGAPVPLWMAALWVNFAATLNESLSWLSGRYAAGALLGAVAGPLSYWAGERLGAIQVNRPWAVALTWALATPALLYAARQLRRPE